MASFRKQRFPLLSASSAWAWLLSSLGLAGKPGKPLYLMTMTRSKSFTRLSNYFDSRCSRQGDDSSRHRRDTCLERRHRSLNVASLPGDVFTGHTEKRLCYDEGIRERRRNWTRVGGRYSRLVSFRKRRNGLCSGKVGSSLLQAW